MSQFQPVLKEFIQDRFSKMGGWCDPAKALDLANLIIDNNAKTIADVGVFEGKSTVAMAFACKLLGKGTVYAIDSWSKEDCIEDEAKHNQEYWLSMDLDKNYENFLSHVVNSNVGRYIDICRMTSLKASKIVPDLDIVHIDANHAEWPSTSDVVNWVPKVKVGGFVVMDDVNWPSTQTAIRFVEKCCKLVVKKELNESQFSIYQKFK